MITTTAAREAILGAIPGSGAEAVAVGSCVGRVLAQSVVAERDQPPFDRVMMDGIAIAHAEFGSGRREFPVQATQAAGDERLVLREGRCIEIMTGASLPENADCVVPIERISMANGKAVIEADYEAQLRQFVHARGSDHRQGTELLTPGKRISATDVAVIASAGLPTIDVASAPSISVISTGNELVPAGAPIAAHQVRLSNGPAVVAMLEQHGFARGRHDHLADEPELLEDRIAQHLEAADVLVLSGGVSMGKADYVPAVLARLGVDVIFHKVSQRPGKPLWFGMGPKNQTVFALPGNPVSTLVCCREYVIPALQQAAGLRAAAPEFASLTQDVSFAPPLTCFLPVRLLSSTAGQALAMPVHTNTSGDFASLAGTDGYVELPLEQTDFPAGTALRLQRW